MALPNKILRNTLIIKVGHCHLPIFLLLFPSYNDNPLKMMKNAFYFIILKALFFPKIYKFLSWLLISKFTTFLKIALGTRLQL